MSKFLFIFIMKISILASCSIQLLIFFIEIFFSQIISDFFLHFLCFKRKIRKICLFLHYWLKLKWSYRRDFFTFILFKKNSLRVIHYHFLVMINTFYKFMHMTGNLSQQANIGQLFKIIGRLEFPAIFDQRKSSQPSQSDFFVES